MAKTKKTKEKKDIIKKASSKIRNKGKKVEKEIKEKVNKKPKKHIILIILMGFLIFIASCVLLFTLFIIK